jgi:hypothetical protein
VAVYFFFLPAPLFVELVVVVVVAELVLVVELVVVVAVGDGNVPIGCVSHEAVPTIVGAWRPAYLATN